MSSRASQVGSREYLSHKSVKSYTPVIQTLFFVVVSAMYLHKTFFLQTYCGPFRPFKKQWYIVTIPIFPYSFPILNSL